MIYYLGSIHFGQPSPEHQAGYTRPEILFYRCVLVYICTETLSYQNSLCDKVQADAHNANIKMLPVAVFCGCKEDALVCDLRRSHGSTTSASCYEPEGEFIFAYKIISMPYMILYVPKEMCLWE